MDTTSTYQLLLTTCGNTEEANKIGHALLKNHLVACVNIINNVQTMYHWQGEIVNDTEVLLLIKTRAEHYAAIEKLLLELHSYEVPELLRLPIEGGLPKYLAWLDDIVAKAK